MEDYAKFWVNLKITFCINLLMNTFILRRNPSPEKTLRYVFFNCHNKYNQANLNQRGLMNTVHTPYVNTSQ